jgi:hypothetical protein
MSEETRKKLSESKKRQKVQRNAKGQFLSVEEVAVATEV